MESRSGRPPITAPAQIRTGATHAYRSYVGFMASNRISGEGYINFGRGDHLTNTRVSRSASTRSFWMRRFRASFTRANGSFHVSALAAASPSSAPHRLPEMLEIPAR